ncbi:hypothetical protein N7470_000482 [Penicillium chermesinum]|nr:hypothetical protein N7470_000482 [Penicillium chermesinum]
MERIRRLAADSVAYEPLEGSSEGPADTEHAEQSRYSRFEYVIFFLLGNAMLWAWNMFLAAAPYFRSRFATSEWAVRNYQSSIMSVSTVTNLATVYVLAKLQKNVSYPRRITISLLVNCVTFTLLAFSTFALKNVSVPVYFGFLMIMVLAASFATGLNQNGVFAYGAGFGRKNIPKQLWVAKEWLEYYLIASVLLVPMETHGGQDRSDEPPAASPKAAFIYFLTATGVSILTLLAFLHLLRRRPGPRPKSVLENEDDELVDLPHDKSVSLWTLFGKLRYLAIAVALCFTFTMMFFPVYTSEIVSVNDPQQSRIYDPRVFTPLALLVWNVGDLAGRTAVAIPGLSIGHRPFLAFLLAVARIGFLPLYLLCNINGHGAVVHSDFFYLVIVQFLFGATNGYLVSSCMMGANFWVDVDEREAAGAFMSIMLVAGLAAGSLLSFFVTSS